MDDTQRRMVLVTGAGQGIGRGIVLHLAREGFVFGVLDVNAETARAMSVEVEAICQRALTLVVNRLDVPAIDDAVVRLVGRCSQLQACRSLARGYTPNYGMVSLVSFAPML